MNGDYWPIHQALQESLKYCLHPRDKVERYGAFSVDLVKQLSASGLFLQLFAAVDIVCAFFSSMLEPVPLLSTLPVNRANERFVGLYQRHLDFISSLFDSPLFRLLRDDARRLVSNERALREEREAELYQAFVFILTELAGECPLVTVNPPFPQNIINQVDWCRFTIPERQPIGAELEKEILDLLGMGMPGPQVEADTPGDSCAASADTADWNGAQVDSRIDVLCGTVFQRYREETNWLQRSNSGESKANEPDQSKKVRYRRRLARLPQVVDYKLIDLYLEFFSKFEPSEKLRRNLSFLNKISRISIETSPFIKEYSRQWTSGAPNPAHLIQGWQRFVLKWMEGEPVFLGRPTPMYEDDRMAIRFFILEELRAACEKIADGNGPPRFSHLNTHKLMALLVGHDIVKYLGLISKLNLTLEFICFHLGEVNPAKTSNEMNTRILRERVNTNTGFMVKDRILQNLLLTEVAAHRVEPLIPSPDFYSHFFEKTESQMASDRYARSYDFFFARGGLFLQENAYEQKHPQAEPHTFDVEEYSPPPGLSGLFATRPYKILPNHRRAFICETNSRYVFASGSDTGRFKPLAVSNGLNSFLEIMRDHILTVITDDAIQFRRSYFERLRA